MIAARKLGRISAVIVVLLSALCADAAPPAGTAFLAADWSNDSVRYLNSNMQPLGSFPVGATLPNSVTFDGSTVYTGHFSNSSVRKFNLDGVFQSSFTNSALGNNQGLAYGNGELATVYDPNSQGIAFLNPATGALIRTIPNNLPGAGSSVEDMVFDGNQLWLLGDSIIAVNPANGAEITRINNPAIGAPFGGTGLALVGASEMMVAGADGSWFRINKTTGALLGSGNNGIQMYGLISVDVPEPAMLSLVVVPAIALATRRRR